jgi:hypothetical protein
MFSLILFTIEKDEPANKVDGTKQCAKLFSLLSL